MELALRDCRNNPFSSSLCPAGLQSDLNTWNGYWGSKDHLWFINQKHNIIWSVSLKSLFHQSSSHTRLVMNRSPDKLMHSDPTLCLFKMVRNGYWLFYRDIDPAERMRFAAFILTTISNYNVMHPGTDVSRDPDNTDRGVAWSFDTNDSAHSTAHDVKTVTNNNVDYEVFYIVSALLRITHSNAQDYAALQMITHVNARGIDTILITHIMNIVLLIASHLIMHTDSPVWILKNVYCRCIAVTVESSNKCK